MDTDNTNDYPLFVDAQKWPVLNLPANLNEKAEASEWYGPNIKIQYII